MKIRAKNGGQTVDITLPATDMDMQYCMKCIGIEDIVPVCVSVRCGMNRPILGS